MNASPDSRAHPSSSIASLLALSDEAFVRAAYLAILGREVDPSGLANYLEQVRTGESKAQIAAELARSPEAQRRATKLAEVAGLADILARPAQPTYSIWARLFKRLTAAAMEPLLKQLRIIDNTAARLDATLQLQSSQLAEIARLLEDGRQASAEAPVRSLKSLETRRAVQPLRLSPSLRQLFTELKAAVAAKRGH